MEQQKRVESSAHRTMAKWSLLATLLTVVVIMLGAWTRLVDAGLGCPDWPGCYGFLAVPQSETSIALANERFPETPVEVEKGWPEMIHRYAAGTLGLVVFGIAAYAIRHRREGIPVKLPMFIAAFVVLQAAFGMWTVTLKLWPQVVALHLLGGFTTITLLTLLTLRLRALRLRFDEMREAALAKLRPFLVVGLLLVIFQIALGAWTASNYAAVACPDLPACQGEWWPADMDFVHGFDIFQSVGPNYLGGQLTADGRVAIHMTHRIGAIAVLVYFTLLLAAFWRHTKRTPLQGMVLLTAAALAVQIALGLINVAFHIPLYVAIAHNAMGAGLLLTVVHMMWRIHGFSAVTATAVPTIKTNREVAL